MSAPQDPPDNTTTTPNTKPESQTLSIKELLQSIADSSGDDPNNQETLSLDNLDDIDIAQHGNLLTQKALFLLGLANDIEQQQLGLSSDDDENEGKKSGKNDQIDDQTSDKSKSNDDTTATTNALRLTDDEKQRTRDLVSLLQSDATALMSYASILKHNIENKIDTDPDTIEKINKIKSKMAQYDQYSDKLVLRTKGIVRDTLDSEECQELLESGKNVLQKWIDKRQLLLTTVLENPDSNELLTKLDNKLGMLLTHKGDLIDIVNDVRVNVVLFLNNVDRYKATILEAANEINDVLDEKDQYTGQSLKDDEDVQFLINKVKEKVKKHVGSTNKSTDTNSSSNNNGDDNDNIIDQEHLEQQSDNIVDSLNSTAHELLSSIEDHDVVKRAIQRGTQLIENNKDDLLDPEKFLSHFNGDNDENNGGKKFNIDNALKLIKDELLTFLLEYLPTVNIPPLEHDDENCTYSIKNIDLSKFFVAHDNVDVLIIENGIFLCATQIECEMDNLLFSYKSKSFPYPGASGVAYAKVTGVRIALELRMEIGTIGDSDEDGDEDNNGDGGNDDSDENVTSNNNSPKQLVVTGANVTQVTPIVEVGNDINTTTNNNKDGGNGQSLVETSLVQSSDPESSPSSQISESSSQIVESSPSSSSQPIDNTAIKKPSTTSKILNKIHTKLDQHTYKLVLFHHPSHGIIKIGHLVMELRDFSFLKSLANFLLNMFQAQVQVYIERTINNVILQESENLLSSINNKVKKYLPKIANIVKKVNDRGVGDKVENIVKNAAKNIHNDVKQQQKQQKSQQSNDVPQLDIPIDKLLSNDDEKKEPTQKQDIKPSD